MFFSNNVLTKKGALAKIWLAAHFADRKLTRSNVDETNILTAVKSIEEHTIAGKEKEITASFSLRLSGQLLLGVCRIYQRKVKFLQEDASAVQLRIQQSLKASNVTATNVDLPQATHSAAAINRAENWADVEYPPLELDIDSIFIPNMIDAAMPQADIDLGEIEMDQLDQMINQSVPLRKSYASQLEVERGRASFEEPLEAIPLDFISQTQNQKDRNSVAPRASLYEPELARASIDNADNVAPVEEMDYPMDMPMMDFPMDLPEDLIVPNEPVQNDVVVNNQVKEKKKRRTVRIEVDDETQLSKEFIRNCLNDRSDIINLNRAKVPLNKKQRLAAYRDSPYYIEHLLTRPSPYTLSRYNSDLFTIFDRVLRVGRPDLPYPRGYTAADIRKSVEPEVTHEEVAEHALPEMDYPMDMPAMDYPMDMPAMDYPADMPEENLPAEVPAAEEPAIAEEPVIEEPENERREFLLEEKNEADATGWTMRSKKMYALLQQDGLSKPKKLSKIMDGSSKRQAASVFYEMLLLKTRDVISVKQDEAYEEILVSRGPKFYKPYNESQEEQSEKDVANIKSPISNKKSSKRSRVSVDSE